CCCFCSFCQRELISVIWRMRQGRFVLLVVFLLLSTLLVLRSCGGLCSGREPRGKVEVNKRQTLEFVNSNAQEQLG
ncbi:hypothetical protein R1flu_025095, partial [Riccia fluitans]